MARKKATLEELEDAGAEFSVKRTSIKVILLLINLVVGWLIVEGFIYVYNLI